MFFDDLPGIRQEASAIFQILMQMIINHIITCDYPEVIKHVSLETNHFVRLLSQLTPSCTLYYSHDGFSSLSLMTRGYCILVPSTSTEADLENHAFADLFIDQQIHFDDPRVNIGWYYKDL